MTPVPPTRVAQLTPPGRGAIATVSLRGPAAVGCVNRLFRPKAPIEWMQAPVGRVLVGRWKLLNASSASGSESPIGEELVVCRTGADQVEVHCHGGTAAVSAVIDSLRQLGCQETPWSELLSTPDETPIRKSARRALATARTQRVAAMLLAQLEGALDGALGRILEVLEQNDLSTAARQLDHLLRYEAIGPRMTDGFRVAFAGSPNVGKSSLINAIMGFQRALVIDQPGTTRDVVTAQTALDGWPVELADTAGIRPTAEPLEAAGIHHARSYLNQCDLVVLVLDASRSPTSSDRDLVQEYSSALLVVNKCDLVATPEWIPPEACSTSARTGAGLEQLLEVIARRLVPHTPSRQAPVPFLESQVAALRQASEALARGNCLLARQHIAGLLAS